VRITRGDILPAIALSCALHAAFIGRSVNHPPRPAQPEVLLLKAIPEPLETEPPTPVKPRTPSHGGRTDPRAHQEATARAATAEQPPASQAAPPAPTAEEWAFASRYTLRNSKGYRHTWGQQVRSMMGTAVEGPDQGSVRFRVEISPEGTLTRLETLWSTSPAAEQLARQAIATLPHWPPTPTGKPLIFERTITFSPHAQDNPPLYRHDCDPRPPAFRNPYAWNGQGAASVDAATAPAEADDPQALADCMRQLPPDTIDAELARDRRIMERWGWSSSVLERPHAP
jgi:TonB family protein